MEWVKNVYVCLAPLCHLWKTLIPFFRLFHRLRLCVAMATVAPPFFLLCWLLHAVSSAFPEEPGPLNYIPTEGIELADFLTL